MTFPSGDTRQYLESFWLSGLGVEAWDAAEHLQVCMTALQGLPDPMSVILTLKTVLKLGYYINIFLMCIVGLWTLLVAQW